MDNFQDSKSVDEIHITSEQLLKILGWYRENILGKYPYAYPFDRVIVKITDTTPETAVGFSPVGDCLYFRFTRLDAENGELIVEDALRRPLLKWVTDLRPNPSDWLITHSEWSYRPIDEESFGKQIQILWTFFMLTTTYVLFHKDNATVVQKTEKRVAKKKSRHHRTKKDHVVYLRSVVYEISPQNEVSEEEKRMYRRQTEAWTVHGHWRHFKNGRKTWVKPHAKGNGRLEAKTYKVK